MPRKYIEPRNTTGWAHLLTEYAWSQRPPLTIGQLAIRAGVRKQTVYNWINGDRRPPKRCRPPSWHLYACHPAPRP